MGDGNRILQVEAAARAIEANAKKTSTSQTEKSWWQSLSEGIDKMLKSSDGKKRDLKVEAGDK